MTGSRPRFVEVLEHFAGTSVGLNRQKNIFRLLAGDDQYGRLLHRIILYLQKRKGKGGEFWIPAKNLRE